MGGGSRADDLLAELRRDASYGQILTTNHSRERMAERGVSAEDVKHSIRSATKAVEQEEGTIRLEGGKDIDVQALVVVVVRTQRGLRLITVM